MAAPCWTKERVALLLARQKDAEHLQALLSGVVRAELWPSTPRLTEEGATHDAARLPALLLVDGLTLSQHSAWLLAQRRAENKHQLFVLLLLAPGRTRQWPEAAYRSCYDDVLLAPLDRTETVLRIRQLLSRRSVELHNTRLLAQNSADAKILRGERQKREQLIATLGHDLRSPLTVSRINADRLAGNITDEVRVKRVGRLIAGLDRIDAMISQLLDAARAENKEADLAQREVCNLRQLTDNVVADMVGIHGDRFVVDVDANINCCIAPADIVRVLENLCSNAVKYGDAGATVEVQGYAEDGRVHLQVANRGDALPAERLDQLFVPFARSEEHERTASIEGWGLGLSMVRSTAEAHGGEVRAFRDAQKRNVFGLTLPWN